MWIHYSEAENGIWPSIEAIHDGNAKDFDFQLISLVDDT